ncbi:tetratricopeptide repeat protein [Pseudonocardia hierapolitana]|uniref:Tetratricopeptide repeat protein n=1 Tax=Pseudonocardia hierapolitana TaxID=1128676 RepID=A0A561SUN8_9PSEU|nr:tetratricopeptide repeat protein [Pseudonocardia hierapolitana]TWF78571.1 tetratricopeptide repeat protein [Pseudonocardia hierapolitana]
MDQSPEDLAVQGVALLAEGRPLEAAEVLRQAVAGGAPSALDLLVRAYFDSGSWRAVVDVLEPHVEQEDLRFAGRLGVALVQLGEWDRAESVLRLAVESGDVPAANDLAILLRDEGRLVEAVHLLVDAAAAGDQLAAANLVALHLEAGDLPAAAAAAERYATERRPDTILALADVRAQQGRFSDADALYRRAGELGALRARTAYGQFLLARGDVAAAEREFREAERIAEPGWAFALGRFLLDEGRVDEARPYLEIAVAEGDRQALEALAEVDGVDADEY